MSFQQGEAQAATKLSNDDAVTKLNHDDVVENNEKKDREQREEEMIEKAVAFWNHPSLRDVSSTEKRTYLTERQGLTSAQVMKVWERIVEAPLVGEDNIINDNRTRPEIIGGRKVTAPQHHPRFYNDNPHLYSHNPQYQPPSLAYDNGFTNHMTSGNQTFYPPSPNHYETEGGDETISIVRGLSLLGVGGVLGVTGAAAVRWLNGGSFELFPSSSTATMNTLCEKLSVEPQIQEPENVKQIMEQNIDCENDEYGEEDESHSSDYSNSDEDFDIAECLLQRMDTLLSSVDSNSELQEKLIHKLANTSTITDDSMNLLKQNIDSSSRPKSSTIGTSDSNALVLKQFEEVRDDLTGLYESMTTNSNFKNDPSEDSGQDWRNEWSKILKKFDMCIQKLEKPVGSFVLDTIAADSKSISTSGSTVTESQDRLDTQSLLAALSTPTAGDKKQTIESPSSAKTSIQLSLKDCISKVVENNNAASVKVGSQLLYLYLANLSGKPNNQRYRKIYTSNESFKKVENLIGGKDLLRAVGFCDERDKSVLEWVPSRSTDKEIKALVLVKEAAAALGVLKKTDNVPTSDLLQLALSELSSLSSSCNEADSNDGDIPQTPSGSSLLSPPMPKKIPFVPTPSDIS